jgi:hypothetical protein
MLKDRDKSSFETDTKNSTPLAHDAYAKGSTRPCTSGPTPQTLDFFAGFIIPLQIWICSIPHPYGKNILHIHDQRP